MSKNPTDALRLDRLRVYFVVLILTVTAQAAHADPHNATISGNITALTTLVEQAAQQHCSSLSCSIPTPVIRLSLKAPHFARLHIKLTEAKITKPERAPPQAADHPGPGSAQEPILLRGYYTVSAIDTTGIPVAATLYRDDIDPVLEVALPERPARGTRDSRGVVIFRASLKNLLSQRVRNSRVQAPPSWLWSQKTCGTNGTAPYAEPSRSYMRRTISSRATLFNVLFVATDYDPQFATKVGCKTTSACYNKIISTVHKAAVFYQDQLGYTLEVARQVGPTEFGRTTNSELLLDTFQQYNFENRLGIVHTGFNTEPNQVDLLQLFTGRTMDDDTIGVAYVGTICRNEQSRFSNSIVQRVSDVLDPVTLAHEIGHTLSAVHVSSGIMRPSLGQNPPSSFASSSLLLISDYLTQWYPECRQGTSDGHGEAPPTPIPTPTKNPNVDSDPFRGKPVTVDLAVASNAPRTLTVTTTTARIEANCSVRLHIGPSATAALRGPVISDVTPTEVTTSRTGSAIFPVNPGKARNPFVYFVAEHTCTDGSILEVSRVRKVNPNRVKGLSKKRRSKRAWISNFSATLQ